MLISWPVSEDGLFLSNHVLTITGLKEPSSSPYHHVLGVSLSSLSQYTSHFHRSAAAASECTIWSGAKVISINNTKNIPQWSGDSNSRPFQSDSPALLPQNVQSLHKAPSGVGKLLYIFSCSATGARLGSQDLMGKPEKGAVETEPHKLWDTQPACKLKDYSETQSPLLLHLQYHPSSPPLIS